MTGLAAFQMRVMLRARWIVGAIAGFAIVSAVVTVLGLGSFRQLGFGAVGPAAVALLNLGILLPTALATVLGALTISADHEGGLLAMVRARGMTGLGIVLAAWLAVTLTTWISVAIGYGVAGLLVTANVPLGDVVGFLELVLVVLGVSAVAAAIGVLIGTLAGTRFQAAILALLAWFILAVGFDLLVIGLAVLFRAGEAGLVLAAIANPLQAARLLALMLLDAAGAVLGPVGTWLHAEVGHEGTLALMTAAIAAWVVLPLVAARWRLGARDL